MAMKVLCRDVKADYTLLTPSFRRQISKTKNRKLLRKIYLKKAVQREKTLKIRTMVLKERQKKQGNYFEVPEWYGNEAEHFGYTESDEPHVPDRREYEILRDFIKNYDNKWSERDYLIFKLIWGRGLRPQEALRLQYNDLREGFIVIPPFKSKTKKTLRYIIKKDLQEELEDWYVKNRKQIDKRLGFMFVGQKGNVMKTCHYSDMFSKKYLRKVFKNKVRKISKNGRKFRKYTLHCGRRCFYSYMDDVLGDKYSISDKCAVSQHLSFGTLQSFYMRKHQKGRIREIIEML